MRPSASIRKRENSPPRALAVWAFLGGHVLLGVGMKHSSILATSHALLVFLVGLYLAATARDAGKIVLVVGYIMTSEVLWRMSHVALFWEFGKYSTAAILLLWILRHPTRRPNWLALIYLIFLLPSAIFTCITLSDFTSLRELISFNLFRPLGAGGLFLRPLPAAAPGRGFS